MPVVAAVAGLSHFVTSAWDWDSLGSAVAKGSPEVVLIDLISGGSSLSKTQELIDHYDQVAKAPRMAVTQSADTPEVSAPYFQDFILYPFETAELSVRIQRLLGRGRSRDAQTLGAGGLVISPESFEVTVDGKQLPLTFKEFELLRYLVAHPGRVHTREALLNQVWGYEYFGGLRTVDVHVRRIRAKLGPKFEDSIQTVHGVGYKYVGKK